MHRPTAAELGQELKNPDLCSRVTAGLIQGNGSAATDCPLLSGTLSADPGQNIHFPRNEL